MALATIRAHDQRNGSLLSPIFVNSESEMVAELRLAYSTVEDVLAKLPASRRKRIALTELEMSAMFAVKAAYEVAEAECASRSAYDPDANS